MVGCHEENLASMAILKAGARGAVQYVVILGEGTLNEWIASEIGLVIICQKMGDR
jgi:hypothetical protein